MLNGIRKFIAGRYGFDKLGQHIAIFSAILLIVSGIVSSYALKAVAYVLLLFCIFRILSKKHVLRMNENRKYFELLAKIKAYVKRDRRYYRYLKCPKCRKVTKVPKHRGRIEITCPHCKYKFIKKT